MASGGNLRTGGQLVVDALQRHGADHVFCVPGESYLAVLDALYDADGIQVTTCRQEGGAAMMADAYGKLTGRPGICMVTRGPGATNASAGVHIAFQDSTPMILLIGQVGRDMIEREAFQEIDYRRMFGQMAKWVAQIDDAERIPEFMSRAFHTATAGRPGPVVLALPEDMLRDLAPVRTVEMFQRATAAPSPADLEKLQELLSSARQPMAIIGGGGWTAEAASEFQHFADAFDLPVGASFRSQDYFDNAHRCYAGHVGIGIAASLAERVREADVLLVVGARLGEATTSGYTLLDSPEPRQKLIHVYPGLEELGRVYRPTLGIPVRPDAFAAAVADMKPKVPPAWRGAADSAHAAYRESATPVAVPGAVQMPEVVAGLRKNLPEDAIVCTGAGNYAIWVNRFFPFHRYRTLLAPTSGSMGYGTPAAVAAKRLYPGRTVVAFAGDGCFLMNGQELATAVQYDLRIIVIVVNNGMYGTIRMHQERDYPTRTVATELVNPDFAALARAYGAHGETVERTEEFAPAFERAKESGRAALIEIRLDPEAITADRSLTDIREAALAKAKR